jgi:hypothetical protein
MRFIPSRWLTAMVSYGMFIEKEKVMSHSDPLFDPTNSFEDDMNYDDYNDFHEMVEDGADDFWYDNDDDSMDGDHNSAMESAGWGTDEDYGYYGDDTPMYDDYYGGE